MAILNSSQVAVYPFHLDTSASLADIQKQMIKEKYSPKDSSSVGWGSVNDDADRVKVPPKTAISPGTPTVLQKTNTAPARLRARYYWLKQDAVARRREGPQAAWRAITVQEAADLLLWDDGAGGFTGLVTDRPNNSKPINALRTVVSALDSGSSITIDTIPERLNPDFFLWLMHRARATPQLSKSMHLGGITQVSSTDGRNRSVDVKDGATLERIELASAIALGITGFGPAKFSLSDKDVAASFFVEVHPDGGFQAYKSSSYDDPKAMQNDFMLRLIEDLWTKVLPRLRALHAADSAWATGGPAAFRDDARNEVRLLLGF